jgi:transcription initiation factor TFIIF subunit alpha
MTTNVIGPKWQFVDTGQSDDDNLSSEDAKPENLGQNASNVPAINVAAAEKTSLKPAPLTTKPKPSEKSLKATTRKRPGSPTLSESSGNESSRKKPKAGHTQENAIMMHGEYICHLYHLSHLLTPSSPHPIHS